MTPNHLTTLRLLTGIGAVASYAVGEAPWHWIGSVLLLASFLLDRADGELARITGKTSRWGHAYDMVTDAAVNAGVFVGIGFGLRHGPLGEWALALGFTAGAAVTAVLWLVVRIERRRGPRAAELESRGGFDADDAMLVVPAAMFLGGAQPLLVVAAIAAPAAAVAMYLHFRPGPPPRGEPGN